MKSMIEPETDWRYAIYDNVSNQFVTSNWSKEKCNQILSLWQNNHPELLMNRFELKHRNYDDDVADNTIALVKDNATNKIVTWFHWDNRHYANAFKNCRIEKYSPPNGVDMAEIISR